MSAYTSQNENKLVIEQVLVRTLTLNWILNRYNPPFWYNVLLWSITKRRQSYTSFIPNGVLCIKHFILSYTNQDKLWECSFFSNVVEAREMIITYSNFFFYIEVHHKLSFMTPRSMTKVCFMACSVSQK